MSALFSAASDNSDNHIENLSISHSNLDENWSDLTEKELENTIFSSSTKSAAKSDKIDFLILQKAYLSISQLFYQLYNKLIKLDFHFDIWKDSIDVIIKKFNKENYSDLKSYRVISLLNCLDKISERIIAERLSYFAEITDLLHFNQINNRK